MRKAKFWAMNKAMRDVIQCERFYLSRRNRMDQADRFWFGHYFRERNRLADRRLKFLTTEEV
jgi:hypothetical protein